MISPSVSDQIDYWCKAPDYYSFIERAHGEKFILPFQADHETEKIVSRHGVLKSAIYYLDDKTYLFAKNYIQQAYSSIHKAVTFSDEQMSTGDTKKLYSLIRELTLIGFFVDCIDNCIDEFIDVLLKNNNSYESKIRDFKRIYDFSKINKRSDVKIVRGEYFLKNSNVIARINQIAQQHFNQDFNLSTVISNLEKDSQYNIFLALTDKKIVGFVYSIFNAVNFEIEYLALDKEFNGNNIGTKLILRALKEAKNLFVQTVSLTYTSFSDNLYENQKCVARDSFYNNLKHYGISITKDEPLHTRNDAQEITATEITIKLGLEGYKYKNAIEQIQNHRKSKKRSLSLNMSHEQKSVE